MDENGSEFDVVADISGGYCFRCAIDYLFSHRKQGNFYFFPDRIIYNSSNESHTVLNDLIYETAELQNYTFKEPPEGYIVAGVDITELRIFLKGVGKKDGVQLYKIKDRNTICVRIISVNSKNGGNFGEIPLIDIDKTIDSGPVFSRNEDRPNKTVNASELTKMCTGLNSHKAEWVYVTAFDSGFLFYTKGTSRHNFAFGQVDYGDTMISSLDILLGGGSQTNMIAPASPGGPKLELVPIGHVRDYKIASKTIKSLSKLNNISNNGNIKIYAETDIDAIKFVSHVGSEGKLVTYIRDVGN